MPAPVLASHEAVENTSETGSIVFDSASLTAPGDGDLLLAMFMNSDFRLIGTPPAGWTLVIKHEDQATGQHTFCYRKEYAMGDTTYTFPWVSYNSESAGGLVHITGHNSANPIDASADQNEASATTTWPAVTTTVADTLIVRFAARSNGYTTIPATTLFNQNTSSADQPGQSAIHHFNQAVAEDIGTETAYNATSGQIGTMTIAVAPAVAGGSYRRSRRRRKRRRTEDYIQQRTWR